MKVGICNLKSANFGDDFLKSVINTGFAVVTNHGIDYGLIKEAQQIWRKFFTQDQKSKNLYINGNDGNMGYKGVGSETAVGSTIADLKEFFHWKPDDYEGDFELPNEAKFVTKMLFDELEGLALTLLQILEKPTRDDYGGDCEMSPTTLFRVLYYPALKSLDTAKGAVRSAAHEDINYITLLVAASAPGLQVQDKDGIWHDVPHEENSITVNIGDMLQMASEGRYKSTTHRVVNPGDDSSDRISMPLFVHPKPETILSKDYTAKKYLKERIDQIYGKK